MANGYLVLHRNSFSNCVGQKKRVFVLFYFLFIFCLLVVVVFFFGTIGGKLGAPASFVIFQNAFYC